MCRKLTGLDTALTIGLMGSFPSTSNGALFVIETPILKLELISYGWTQSERDYAFR
jgi:hypothetical protein